MLLPDFAASPLVTLKLNAIQSDFTSLVLPSGTSGLVEFAVSNNLRLTGTLPSELFTLNPKLQALRASGTLLSGTMPNMGVLNPPALTTIDLSYTAIDFCVGTRIPWTATLSVCFLHSTSAFYCPNAYPPACQTSAPLTPPPVTPPPVFVPVNPPIPATPISSPIGPTPVTAVPTGSAPIVIPIAQPFAQPTSPQPIPAPISAPIAAPIASTPIVEPTEPLFEPIAPIPQAIPEVVPIDVSGPIEASTPPIALNPVVSGPEQVPAVETPQLTPTSAPAEMIPGAEIPTPSSAARLSAPLIMVLFVFIDLL